MNAPHDAATNRGVTVFWGDGKGKTTAAIGLAVRCLGHGLRVHIVPFLKGSGCSSAYCGQAGEMKVLKALPNCSVYESSGTGWVDGACTEEQKRSISEAFEEAESTAASGSFDLLVLDEILYAVNLGLLPVDSVLRLVGRRSKTTELVLTGGWEALESIERVADLVTEMRKVKHPFDAGIGSRIGLEY